MLVLQILACLGALLLVVSALWDAFETMVLPRRIARRFRLTRVYTLGTWYAWAAIARRIRSASRREALLAVHGPLALIGLLAVWVALLVIGFGLLQWGLGSHLVDQAHRASIGSDLYFSGTTLLTLGLGDVVPRTGQARLVTVIEVGTGFGLLALVIGYLPVLYQAFSRRETRISLLDAHAGSPPTAGALLLRHPPGQRAARLTGILAEWEGWSAELLESHLSFPLLAHYRSQHEEQSWVAALTMILDACALVLACSKVQPLDTSLTEQATFTFAIARHAAADLAQSFAVSGREVGAIERSGAAQRTRLIDGLSALGLVRNTEMADGVQIEIDALRQLYEGHMVALGQLLLMEVPPWMPAPDAVDDWQTTADDLTAPPIAELEFRDGRLRAARRGAARPTATGARAEQDTTPPISGS